MNLLNDKAAEYLEEISKRCTQLSIRADTLKKMVRGGRLDGENPFEYKETLAPIKRLIDDAWDKLHKQQRTER